MELIIEVDILVLIPLNGSSFSSKHRDQIKYIVGGLYSVAVSESFRRLGLKEAYR